MPIYIKCEECFVFIGILSEEVVSMPCITTPWTRRSLVLSIPW